MTDKIQAKVPVATGVSLSADPSANHSGLFFKTEADPGYVAVSLANKELAQLMTLLLKQAQEIADKSPPGSAPAAMQATPIRPTQIGVAPGRDLKEAVIGFRVGNLDLSLAVPTDVLHQMCTQFLANTKKQQPPTQQ